MVDKFKIGSEFFFLHDLVLTCKAINNAGTAEEQIKLHVYQLVSFINSENQHLKVESGNAVSLNCNVFGFPQPKITWFNKHNQTLIYGYESEIELLPETDLEILCQAENSVNSVIKSFVIELLFYPEILNYQEIDELHLSEKYLVEEFAGIDLVCQAKSNPIAKISWRKGDSANNFIDFELNPVSEITDKDAKIVTSTLSLNNITRKDQGSYICEAENYLGVDQFDQFITVLFAPEITDIKLLKDGYDISIENIMLGDQISLVCQGFGRPEPYIYWKIYDSKSGQLNSISGYKINLEAKEHINATCFVENELKIVSQNFYADITYRRDLGTDLHDIQGGCGFMHGPKLPIIA